MGPASQQDINPIEPLLLSSLHVSREEVLSVLPLPFKCMIDGDSGPKEVHDRLSWQLFRGDWAYRTVAVGDLPVYCDAPTQVDGPHEGLGGQDSVGAGSGQTAFEDYHKPGRTLLPDRPVGGMSETKAPQRSSLDVWGLTGWFLNVFMWRMGHWRDVEAAGGKALEVEQPGRGSRL